jgi:hypothetical protein
MNGPTSTAEVRYGIKGEIMFSNKPEGKVAIMPEIKANQKEQLF